MADESEDIEASTTSNAPSGSGQPQLLQVTPKDLYFPPPFTRDIASTIVLHNPTADPVTFKIKTTAPKRYIVRPPLGICPAGQTVEIAVTLSYHKDPPAQPEKGDKFQVQAFTLKSPPDSAQDSLKEIWRGKPAVTKTKIAAHFAEAPAAPAAVTTEIPGNPIVAQEPVVTPSVPKAVEPVVAAIVQTSHQPKARVTAVETHTVTSNPSHAPFDGHLDPVSTVAPTSAPNTLIPLLLAFLLGLLLGLSIGIYYTSGSSAPAVAEAAASSFNAARTKSS